MSIVDEKKTPAPKKRRSKWRIFFGVMIVLAIILGAARLAAPTFIQWYVNRTLARLELYRGTIGEVRLHVWRGAYSIEEVKISKVTGNVPVPFFAAKTVDFAIEWKNLLNRKIVGTVKMIQPELNFVDGDDPSQDQTGAGGPWLDILSDLFPFKINSCEIQDGSVHFHAYQRKPQVDLFASKLNATIDNLGNIKDEVNPLISTVKAQALVLDHAELDLSIKLDPFSYRPTFQMAVKLIGLDVTKLNDFGRAYGSFDFERGFFDLVVELDSKEGQMEGYVKPLFRQLIILGPKDLKEDNIIQIFWEALLGGTTGLLKNQPRDQFGTQIPLRGDVDAMKPDILATIGNVLRNAFIRAYLPKFRRSPEDTSLIQFRPGSVTDPGAGGDGTN